MLEAGKILQNRYLIQKQIGQGGMGSVYVAVDQRFGSIVAIKETLFLGENFEKAFEREARLLNSLRHPALPNVRDYFSEEHNQYLVMEFIPGEDLSEKLEKNGKAFDIEEVLDWSRQLLEALEFLHTQEIPVIHRDIKPQNLKLTPNGQIILLDFGLAKGNPTDASHLTNAKSIFGYSRNYASLEQMQGTGTDPRSDLYSLAATVYHLATGAPPVDALTRAMSVLSEKADPLVPANEIHDQVSKGIANILHNAMDLNAGQRPASAREMLEMLNNSERYADMELKKTAVTKAVPTGFLNQETQIFPATGSNLTTGQKAFVNTGDGELQTKVNKNKYSSENYKTNVVTGNLEEGRKPGSRKRFYAIAAVMSLVLMALGASALMVLSEGDNARQSNIGTEPAAENKPSVFQVTVENANLNSVNDDNSASNLEVAEAPPGSETSPSKDTKSPAPSSKNKAGEKKKNEQSDPMNDTEMVIVDPEEGTVILKGNKIETDKMVIDEKGVIYKKPPVPPFPPDVKMKELSPEELKRLTPRQIQRLNQLRLDIERRTRMLEQRKRANVSTEPSPE